MLGWITEYFYPPENVDYIDPDSPEQTIKYVFLEKLKVIEENCGRNMNKINKLENENYELKKQLKKTSSSMRYFHDRIIFLEQKLENSIVLEPLPPL